MLHLSQENFSLDKAVLLAARHPSKLLESFTLYKQAFALDVDSPLCKRLTHPDDLNQLQEMMIGTYHHIFNHYNQIMFSPQSFWKKFANISDQTTMLGCSL